MSYHFFCFFDQTISKQKHIYSLNMLEIAQQTVLQSVHFLEFELFQVVVF